MRVLHVAQPTTEGVPRVVLDLVRDQVARGWQVAVACPPGGELGSAARERGARWLPWPATRSPGPSSPAETLRLRRLVRSERPDVVHLHSAKAGLAGRLGPRRTPVVFAPHAWSFEAVRGPVRAATLRWERWAAPRTDLLVCVSRAEQAAGEQAGVHARRTLVVPNGVDLDRWAPAGPADRVAARARLGLPATAPLAVCVGRLARQKGQDLLLDAWERARAALADAELVLVGDGPEAATLSARAGHDVHLVGARADVADWLAAADVVVVPSRWEGMALVPREAMARARSVVAFDVAGVRESVPPAAGAVVGSGGVPALAAAVAERLGDRSRADAEGRAGRAHVEQAHDVRLGAARVAQAYAGLVGAVIGGDEPAAPPPDPVHPG
jgi:glycosyltransferase involved in cell wall biosynthesis